MRNKLMSVLVLMALAGILINVALGQNCQGTGEIRSVLDTVAEISRKMGANLSEKIFDIEEAISVIETAQAEIDLKYIPEMGYDDNIQLGGPYKMGDNQYNVDSMEKRNYACWKDWLIIGNEVYKKQEDGRYKRFGEHYLNEMFESYLDSRSDIRQYENYLIFLSQKTMGEDEPSEFCFCIYDLDTEKMVERDDFLEEGGIFTFYTLYGAPNFYVFEGKIYYRPRDCKSIRTIDLSNGKNEEFYSLAGTAYQRIGDFAIREDGAVMAVFWGEEANPDDFPEEKRDALLPCHIEYWCIEPGEDGLKETKIGETGDFPFADIQVVRDGLVLDCGVPQRDNWVIIRDYYLKENGEMTSIALRGHGFGEVRCVEDGFYYFDSTEYPETREEPLDYRWHINAISKYDFDGNKIDTYCLANPAKLEEGYKIIDILIYDGKATAFFVDENEEYLYINQIPVGLETEMPADGTEQIKKLQEEGIENNPEELSVWEGRYNFHEICPPIDPDGLYVGMDYDIEIYPDGRGGYYADVRIEGYQTCYLFRANVYGNSREIHLYFEDTLFENREWGWPIKTVDQVQEEEKKPRRRGGDSRSVRQAVDLDEEIMSFVRDENGGGIYTTLGQLEGSELLIVNIEAGGIYLDKVE